MNLKSLALVLCWVRDTQHSGVEDLRAVGDTLETLLHREVQKDGRGDAPTNELVQELVSWTAGQEL